MTRAFQRLAMFALSLGGTIAALALASHESGAASHHRGNDAGPVVLTPLRPPSQAVSEFKLTKTPPDPDPPMRERKQWIVDLRWDKGSLFYLGAHPLDLGAPQATPRMMGRFALELFEGPTLIERVRFDFPLLGADEPIDAGYMDRPTFSRKLVTRIGVMFPASRRGTRLELWDRRTDLRYTLPWPLVEDAPIADASPCDGACE